MDLWQTQVGPSLKENGGGREIYQRRQGGFTISIHKIFEKKMMTMMVVIMMMVMVMVVMMMVMVMIWRKQKVISKETRLISNFNPKGFLGIVKLIHPTISETLSKNSRKLKSV